MTDAVDIITQNILDRKTIEPIQGFSEEDLIRQKCMQNDIMQNHADYTGDLLCWCVSCKCLRSSTED